jgi:hypothetical protein
MQNLQSGQHAFIAAWGRTEMFKIGTIESFYESSTTPADVAAERIAKAHASNEANATVWAMKTGATIVNSPAYYERLKAKQAAAVELDPAQPVEINGRKYAVKLMGKRYSDPVHFIPVAA